MRDHTHMLSTAACGDGLCASAPPVVEVPPPPPLGWVFGGYTNCGDPSCGTLFVTVPADGLNVRTIPNGPAVLSLVNGTPLVVVQRQGDWTLVAPGCSTNRIVVVDRWRSVERLFVT